MPNSHEIIVDPCYTSLMPTDAHHDRISVTAKLAAYYRQFTDIPFAKEVAGAIGADETFTKIVSENGIAPMALREYALLFEARYKSIDSLLRKRDALQVLELASGFSLRGLALAAQNPKLTYVDTDLEALNKEKLALLPGILAHSGAQEVQNYLVRDANALDAAGLLVSCENFRHDLPIAVVNEGLILYLTASERDQLVRNIRSLLQRFGGFWVTPDFTVRSDASHSQVSEQRKRLREIITGMTERQVYDSAFPSSEEMERFFSKMGFTAQTYSQIDETPKLTSLDALGLTSAVVERFRPALKIWILSLN